MTPTPLYLLAEGSRFPGEVLLSGCLEPQYEIIKSGTLDELLTQLESYIVDQVYQPSANQSVLVMISLPARKIHKALLQIKAVLPNAACLAVIEANEEKEVKLSEWDCLFLSRPLNEFLVKTSVATALRISTLQSQLIDLAHLDERTGLYNQQYFITRVSEELARSRRYGNVVSCSVLSVGYYQMLLDSYGYDFTNAMMKHIGKTVEGHIRHEDVVARIGDQELALLLPSSPANGAQVLLQRVITDLTSVPFQHRSYEESIALFAGICEFPLPEPAATQGPVDADTMIRYAHHALHNAKQQEDPQRCIQVFHDLYPLEDAKA